MPIAEHSLELLEYPKIIQQLTVLAQSHLGRMRCTDLLPQTDPEQVCENLAETTDAVQILLQKGEPPLQGLHDLSEPFRKLHAGVEFTCAQLFQLGTFLRAARKIHSFAPNLEEEHALRPNRYVQWMRRLVILEDLEKKLGRALVSETEVSDDASVELFQIRRKKKRTQEQIRQTLEALLHKQSELLQEQLITLRSNRYVLPVKESNKNVFPGIVHDRSASGQTVFIEPLQVVEANNQIRELEAEEREEIQKILRVLSEEVRLHLNDLEQNLEYMTQIDFVTAKAKLSLQQKAFPAQLNEDGILALYQARHPLLPQDRAVPIDLSFGSDNSTLLITGPNTGGKTVALKTCGLLTLMTLAGLHIPASEKSKIPFFEELLVDLGDAQSIEESLSTFSSHMKNLIEMTEKAREKTLILSDELGSGTDPLEGAALAQAILETWKEKGATILATTHYRELKEYALATDGVENASCELDPDTFRPTYRILMGTVGTSHAFEISRRLGLPSPLIERAENLLSVEDRQIEHLMERLTCQEQKLNKALETADLAQKEARAIKEEAEQKLIWVNQKKRDVVQRTREEIRAQYFEKMRQLDEWISEMKKPSASRDLKEWEKRRREVGEDFNRLEGVIGAETLAAYRTNNQQEVVLKLGELYAASHLGVSGRLVSLPDSKGMCKLSTGTLQVNVPANSLRPGKPSGNSGGKSLEEKSAYYKQKNAVRKTVFSEGTQTPALELILLGDTVADAIQKLDLHIDQAQMAGFHEIRIVHGKGTGALRKGVHDFLKRDRRIQNYHLAAYGEGDSGVTVAQI